LIGDLNFRLEWGQEEIKSVIYEVRKKFSKESLKMGTAANLNTSALSQSLQPLWQKDELITYQKDTTDYLHNFK
jgi:hypothetical protein